MTTLVHTWLAAPASHDRGLHSGDDPSHLRYRSWEQIREAARNTAGALADAGVGPGGRVAILAADPGDVAELVQATWMRGAAFTMLHQPTPRADLAAWLDDTRDAIAVLGADAVIVGEPFVEAMAGIDLGARVLTVADLRSAGTLPPEPVGPDDIAILQLTSGSTGTPKAVVITFDNLEANHRAMCAGLELTGDDVTVSWLPLFHDMGMVGLMVLPMLENITAVITTPRAFLGKPEVWAELISRFRGTCTAAPNFAYTVLAKRLRRAADGAYDLSSMRMAINGAEPIDEASLTAILDEGARFGLRPEAVLPCYGMAETTLAVSFDALDTRFVVDSIEARPAETTGEVRRAHTPGSVSHVRLGTPLSGIELTVVDDDGRTLAPDRIGTLLVRGDAVTARYLGPDGFVDARDADGRLDTGDLGYVTASGDVVVTGRKKDIIIVSGRNLSPTVIERAACAVDGVRAGNAAAVAHRRPDGREGLAVIAEVDPTATAGADDEAAATQRIHDGIARAVFDAVGVPVSAVALLGRGELPKTTSGKIRRHSAAELVAEGTA